jgi:hypothetical protein
MKNGIERLNKQPKKIRSREKREFIKSPISVPVSLYANADLFNLESNNSRLGTPAS